ncbi:hypothetical protein NDU88_004435 [Pleurodeles waltl]|uniref:Uncharacterized protein n=1 Tax=Pleurodeles waltl TaxID=8319 RepID=A0AAV7SIR5_PLEWA|nr:hypothetical protein NDU88_004435 [Pleurodeles waltl]
MMWCDRSQVLEVKAVVVLSQEHIVTARVVLPGREMCGVLLKPRRAKAVSTVMPCENPRAGSGARRGSRTRKYDG